MNAKIIFFIGFFCTAMVIASHVGAHQVAVNHNLMGSNVSAPAQLLSLSIVDGLGESDAQIGQIEFFVDIEQSRIYIINYWCIAPRLYKSSLEILLSMLHMKYLEISNIIFPVQLLENDQCLIDILQGLGFEQEIDGLSLKIIKCSLCDVLYGDEYWERESEQQPIIGDDEYDRATSF